MLTNWVISPFSLAQGLIAMVTMFMAVNVWQRRGIPGSQTLGFLFLSVSLWALMTAFHISSASLDAKDLWIKIQLIGICTAPLLTLLYILEYTNQEDLLRPWVLVLLWVVPAITIIAGLTNDFHHLYWTGARLVPGTILVELQYGPAFWVYVIYACLLLFIATMLLIRSWLTNPLVYRRQAFILMLVILIPWIGNFVTLAKIAPGYDFTPTGFFITAALLYWAIYRRGIFRLAPIAREKILGWMEDGFIILDGANNIVDINPQAEAMLARAASGDPRAAKGGPGAATETLATWVGQSAEKLVEVWPTLQPAYPFDAEGEHDVTLDEGENTEYIDLDISQLKGRDGQAIGSLLLLHDVTRLKLAQQEAHQRRLVAEALYDTSAILAAPGDFNESIQKVLTRIRDVLPWEGVICALEEGGTLHPVFHEGLILAPRSPGLGLNAALAIDEEDAELPSIRGTARQRLRAIDPGIATILTTPVLYQNKVTGLVSFFRREDRPFAPDEERTAASLATQIATAQANMRMFQQVQQLAVTDALTGKNNRRQFFTLASESFNHALRYQEPISVIMLDIDHFKNINDLHGHQAGDAILIAVSDTCKGQVRAVDVFARYGGEEFIIALPQTHLKEAALVAERIRQAVEKSEYYFHDQPIPVTISLGVTEDNKSQDTIETLIERSDQALYQAKESGRNRVCTIPELAGG